MPGIEPFQVQKTKKFHPLVLFLITPVGFEDVWEAQIAKLMDYGKTEISEISVYNLLCRYQRDRTVIEELDLQPLWERIMDEKAEALDF